MFRTFLRAALIAVPAAIVAAYLTIAAYVAFVVHEPIRNALVEGLWFSPFVVPRSAVLGLLIAVIAVALRRRRSLGKDAALVAIASAAGAASIYLLTARSTHVNPPLAAICAAVAHAVTAAGCLALINLYDAYRRALST